MPAAAQLTPQPRTHTRRAALMAIAASALAMLIAALPTTVAAQPFPTRAVRIIVPSPPGDGSDLTARALAQRLSESWGTSGGR